MHKVFVILRKEFSEILQQRVLLYSVFLPPLLFDVIPLLILHLGGNGTRASSIRIPSLQGLTLHEYTQGVIGTEFSNFFILLSMVVPSTIAAYSIIGEKSNRTLEPLLATPVLRWQLLAGKILAALLPSVLVTWVSGSVFIAELAVFTDANVVSHVVTEGWLILFIVGTPLLGLIAVSIMTAISSQVNDTRTAQQLSIWAVVPVIGIILGELSGQFELTVFIAVVFDLILIPVAIFMTWGASQLFQRETILTRWK